MVRARVGKLVGGVWLVVYVVLRVDWGWFMGVGETAWAGKGAGGVGGWDVAVQGRRSTWAWLEGVVMMALRRGCG